LLARDFVDPLSRAAARHARDITKVLTSPAFMSRRGAIYGLAAGVSSNASAKAKSLHETQIP
jgi:hypothetical protein